LTRLPLKDEFDFRLKFIMDGAGRAVSVNGVELIKLLHESEFLLDLALIFDET